MPTPKAPEIIALSNLLRSLPYHAEAAKQPTVRNPDGVGFKLMNLRQVATGKGLGNVSSMDRQIWKEFGERRDEVHKLAAAIKLGIAITGSEQLPEVEQELPEGRLLTALHIRRERNPKVRKILLDDRRVAGFRCEICNVTRSDLDEPLQEAMFEAHHLVPLAEADERKTKLADLALLCACCHRLIHRAMISNARWVGSSRPEVSSCRDNPWHPCRGILRVTFNIVGGHMATIRKLRGRWQAQVRRRGMKSRCKSFDSKLEAEKWARDLEAQVDRFGAAPDTKILERTTLGQLLERYQLEISPTKRGSVQEIQRIGVLRRHDLAYRTLIGLSQQDIASFRDERLQSVAPSTIVRELAILSHVLEVAIRDWGLPLSKNVVKLVRRPVIRNERSRRLTGDEEQRLLDGCETGQIPYLKTLLILAIETGMRRGEILGLRWSDISHNRRVITLAMTKNGSGREVPLSQRAFDALTDWKSRADLDPSTVFPMTAGALAQAWRRLLARSNVKELRFHDLRHEGVSRLFERGLNMIEVSSISGHNELRMLKRYTHLSADDLVARLG